LLAGTTVAPRALGRSFSSANQAVARAIATTARASASRASRTGLVLVDLPAELHRRAQVPPAAIAGEACVTRNVPSPVSVPE